MDDYSNEVLNTVFHVVVNYTIPNVIPSTHEAPEFFWLSYSELTNHEKCPIWLKDYLEIIRG